MMHQKYAGPENCLWQKISAAYNSDILSYDHKLCRMSLKMAAVRNVTRLPLWMQHSVLQVLHFQTATRFHATRVNVLWFRPITEARPSLRNFLRNSRTVRITMCKHLYQISSKSDEKYKKKKTAGKIKCTSLKDVRLFSASIFTKFSIALRLNVQLFDTDCTQIGK